MKVRNRMVSTDDTAIMIMWSRLRHSKSFIYEPLESSYVDIFSSFSQLMMLEKRVKVGTTKTCIEQNIITLRTKYW